MRATQRQRAGNDFKTRLTRQAKLSETPSAQIERGAALRVELDVGCPHHGKDPIVVRERLNALGRLQGAVVANQADIPVGKMRAIANETREIIRDVQERNPRVVGKRSEQLGLGTRDVLAAAQELDMAFAHVGEQTPRGFHERTERIKLMQPAHAHLDDDRSCIGLGRKKRFGNADLVVPVSLGGHDGAVSGKNVANEVLGSGFSR